LVSLCICALARFSETRAPTAASLWPISKRVGCIKKNEPSLWAPIGLAAEHAVVPLSARADPILWEPGLIALWGQLKVKLVRPHFNAGPIVIISALMAELSDAAAVESGWHHRWLGARTASRVSEQIGAKICLSRWQVCCLRAHRLLTTARV
jgi:hypothetical protein